MQPAAQTYNGVMMSVERIKLLEAAQASPKFIKRNGTEHPRLRYGDESEDVGADSGLCSDCGARKGQYHAFGCERECCPLCGGQALDCQHYWYDDEDYDPTVGEVAW